MECDMPKPCQFPSLDSWQSCQKRFLWTHKDVDLNLHPVLDLVLHVGDTEKFPHALGFKSLDPFFFSFFQSESRVYVLQLLRRMEVTRDL